jgi:hypothetical protein
MIEFNFVKEPEGASQSASVDVVSAPEPVSVDTVLAERGSVYGDFACVADYSQQIKAVYTESTNWYTMEAHQREAMDFIANKLGRILAGNPNHLDNWVDIAGYATLVVRQLEKTLRTE